MTVETETKTKGPTVADNAIGWVGAAVGGAIVSLLYFAGLWWTVQRIAGARHPLALLALSFVFRAALAAGALWLMMQGEIVRLLVALAAFLLVRAAVLWRMRPPLHEVRADARSR